MTDEIINGFSSLSREEKAKLVTLPLARPEKLMKLFDFSLYQSEDMQKQFLEMSENTLASYHLPYSVAPNVMVDGKVYHVPMVTEESSVVAAAAYSSKFWANRGGFKVENIATTKLGHIYFLWNENPMDLTSNWPFLRFVLLEKIKPLIKNMEERGGGIVSLEIENLTYSVPNLFRINTEFDTVDSMGANFINTCLEEIALELKRYYSVKVDNRKKEVLQIVMSILSNYVDGCTVTVSAQCNIGDLDGVEKGLTGAELAHRIQTGFDIARVDIYRATTHNKGIMNGVDAVLIATGNDFRAAEAAAHAFASRTGRYTSLSNCTVENDVFKICLTMPLAVGTVGGITNLHPMAKASMELLGHPSASQLMAIVASVGLASNFSAVKNLVTTGIQHGHMKMHLSNILSSLGVDNVTRERVLEYFRNRTVSYSAVKEFLDQD
jgi:Hydroxymethylglutaryl-CoA reductase